MRYTIISLLLLGASLNLTGQADYGNKVEAIKLCKALQGNQFSNYREANTAIEDILSVIGAKNRFVVQPCDNIKNAMAVTMQGIRYIFYDPDFMTSISSGIYSSNLFILAHEVGHHINGHSQDIIMLLSDYAPTSNTLAEQRAEELEADEFAGFVLGKLGHPLSSMENTLRAVADDEDDTYSTHPNLSKRLTAVATGYNKSKGNEALPTNLSPSKRTAEEYFYSGYDKSLLGDYRGAIEDFNKAIQLDPDYTLAYSIRGFTKAFLGDDRGAIEDFNKAIQFEPDLTDAYTLRGVAKSHLGDNRGAIEDYNKAIQLDPDNNKAYYNRGITKSTLGDARGAIQDLTMAIQLNPDEPQQYTKRGACKFTSGDYEGAIQDFTKAIQFNPDDHKLYTFRGYSKSYLGDERGALEDYNKAIQLDPDDPNIYVIRAGAKFDLGDKNGACLDLSKAGELGHMEAYDMIREACK